MSAGPRPGYVDGVSAIQVRGVPRDVAEAVRNLASATNRTHSALFCDLWALRGELVRMAYGGDTVRRRDLVRLLEEHALEPRVV